MNFINKHIVNTYTTYLCIQGIRFCFQETDPVHFAVHLLANEGH